jgi:hypothetical protein
LEVISRELGDRERLIVAFRLHLQIRFVFLVWYTKLWGKGISGQVRRGCIPCYPRVIMSCNVQPPPTKNTLRDYSLGNYFSQYTVIHSLLTICSTEGIYSLLKKSSVIPHSRW